MPTFLKTHRAYALVTATLTLIATVLRALSVTLFTERASGYFKSAATLPRLTHVFMVLAAACLVLYPFFLKPRPAARTGKHTPAVTASALLCALLFFVNFINACLAETALPGLLLALTFLALLCGTLYFVLLLPTFKATPALLTVFGGFAIMALACLVALTYFDIATPMNAPHKAELHLALLAAMLYLIYELRDTAKIPMPRMLAATGALAFFLAVTVGLSNLLGYACGVYQSPLYLAEDLLLPALAVYICARSGANATQETERKDRAT